MKIQIIITMSDEEPTTIQEGGFTYYLLEDGRVVDSLDDDTQDMSWDSLEEFLASY
jgi:hypothetical protein